MIRADNEPMQRPPSIPLPATAANHNHAAAIIHEPISQCQARRKRTARVQWFRNHDQRHGSLDDDGHRGESVVGDPHAPWDGNYNYYGYGGETYATCNGKYNYYGYTGDTDLTCGSNYS